MGTCMSNHQQLLNEINKPENRKLLLESLINHNDVILDKLETNYPLNVYCSKCKCYCHLNTTLSNKSIGKLSNHENNTTSNINANQDVYNSLVFKIVAVDQQTGEEEIINNCVNITTPSKRYGFVVNPEQEQQQQQQIQPPSSSSSSYNKNSMQRIKGRNYYIDNNNNNEDSLNEENYNFDTLSSSKSYKQQTSKLKDSGSSNNRQHKLLKNSNTNIVNNEQYSMKYAQQKNNDLNANKLHNKKMHSRLQQNTTPTNFYHENNSNKFKTRKYNQDLNYFYSQNADYHDLNEDKRGINYLSSDTEQIGIKKHLKQYQQRQQQHNYRELHEINNQYEHDLDDKFNSNENDYDIESGKSNDEQVEMMRDKEEELGFDDDDDDENNYYMMMLNKKQIFNKKKGYQQSQSLNKNYKTKYSDNNLKQQQQQQHQNSYLRSCNNISEEYREYDEIDIDKLDDYNDINLNIIEFSRAASKRLISDPNSNLKYSSNLNSNEHSTPPLVSNKKQSNKASSNQNANLIKISNANLISEQCVKTNADQLDSKKAKELKLKSKNFTSDLSKANANDIQTLIPLSQVNNATSNASTLNAAYYNNNNNNNSNNNSSNSDLVNTVNTSNNNKILNNTSIEIIQNIDNKQYNNNKLKNKVHFINKDDDEISSSRSENEKVDFNAGNNSEENRDEHNHDDDDVKLKINNNFDLGELNTEVNKNGNNINNNSFNCCIKNPEANCKIANSLNSNETTTGNVLNINKTNYTDHTNINRKAEIKETLEEEEILIQKEENIFLDELNEQSANKNSSNLDSDNSSRTQAQKEHNSKLAKFKLDIKEKTQIQQSSNSQDFLNKTNSASTKPQQNQQAARSTSLSSLASSSKETSQGLEINTNKPFKLLLIDEPTQLIEIPSLSNIASFSSLSSIISDKISKSLSLTGCDKSDNSSISSDSSEVSNLSWSFQKQEETSGSIGEDLSNMNKEIADKKSDSLLSAKEKKEAQSASNDEASSNEASISSNEKLKIQSIVEAVGFFIFPSAGYLNLAFRDLLREIKLYDSFQYVFWLFLFC